MHKRMLETQQRRRGTGDACLSILRSSNSFFPISRGGPRKLSSRENQMRKAVLFAVVIGWVILGGLGTDATRAQAVRAVPLPSTLPLLGMGLAALGASLRKHK
jgi:hypothetical protein